MLCTISNSRSRQRFALFVVDSFVTNLVLKELARQVDKMSGNAEKYDKTHVLTVEHRVDERLLAASDAASFFSPSTFYETHILRKEDFSAYSLGQCQSPINLSAKTALLNPRLGPVCFFYQTAAGRVGTNIFLNINENGHFVHCQQQNILKAHFLS